MASDFSINHQALAVPDTYLITVIGSVDMARAMIMEETARALIRVGNEKLIFDLGGLTYINTKGLGVLLTLQKSLDHGEGGVWVVGSYGRVKNSIEITGLNRVIQLYSQLEDVLKSLNF